MTHLALFLLIFYFRFSVVHICIISLIFFFKQNTAYEMRISDWSSDVCSSDLECELLEADGWIRRAQLRYVWHAHDADSFDAFLARLPSKKRKNIRAERRKLADFAISWRAGDTFSADEWRRLFQLYASTYAMRGQIGRASRRERVCQYG